MWEDEIVNEVRQAREAYTVRFGCDLNAIYEDIKQREQASARKIVAPPARAASDVPVGDGALTASASSSDVATLAATGMQQAEMVVAPQVQTEGKSRQLAQHVGQER